MNILFLSRDYPPNLIGGVGIYVYEASRILAKMRHKVFVITGAVEHPLEYVDQGVRIFRVRSKKQRIFDPLRDKLNGFIERLEYSWAVSKKIIEVVSKYKIDIIESSEARAEGFWYYFIRNNPPLVVKLHTPEGLVYKLNRDPLTHDRQLIEKLEEWWICRANRLIGLSRPIVSLTQNYYRIKSNNLPIVSNPIDTDKFKPAHLAGDKGYILYAGRLEYRKGVHVLIRSIPLVLKRFPQAKFIFIGSDCGMGQYLQAKVNESGIQNAVEFIEQVQRDSMVSYYQQCAFCVVPSLWENHPYVILEAMACGKPVIASDAGGIPEIIKDGINGLLVSPGSVADLADRIVRLLNDRDMRDRLGDSSRRYIEEQYASVKVVQKTLDIYKELVH